MRRGASVQVTGESLEICNSILKITIWATRKATRPVSNFAQQLLPARNNMQQGVNATCNIQQCWEFLGSNVNTTEPDTCRSLK